MRKHAVRVSQWPGWERVGGEAGVHDRQRGFHAFILQVQVEVTQLRSGEHALVHNGASRKRREVDGFATGAFTGTLLSELSLGTLADEPGSAVQL